MTWFRRISTWHRVVLAIGLVLLVLASANLVFDLGWPFATFALSVWALVMSIVSFREFMRQAIAAEKRPESKPPSDEG